MVHAIVTAVVAALLSFLLFKVIRKQRLLGVDMGAIGLGYRLAQILLLAGLVLCVLVIVGIGGLGWSPWLVWAGVVIYLVATIARAVGRLKGGGF